MAHESFEHEPTAEVMNKLFVNVKVDREERPDVDAVYMDAVQALSGRGGWPMTVFCTPTGEPFYGGTYYPRESFVKLLNAVDDAWTNRRDELQQNVDALVEVIGRTRNVTPADAIDTESIVQQTLGQLQNDFDVQWGGFGSAPKFPSTFALDLLLREYQRTGDTALLGIVETSLHAMAAGGMYDHIGGGFARYSVDQQWLVPHFEKMLYDQALLLRVYTHAWLVTKEPVFRQVAEEIIAYVLNEMTDESGGFYSAEDADSLDEHGHSEEGAFYTWTPREIREVLGDNAQEALTWWNIIEEGNFEGRNIPHRIPQRGNLIRPLSVEKARQQLFEHRALRHRPGLDDKVLTEWNAMMLSSLCEAASAFDRADITTAVVRNAEFLRDQVRTPSGSWHRSWQPNATPHAQHAGLAQDLAHLVDAFTRVYELTSDHQWLELATRAANTLMSDFWDADNGGFFTVSEQAEQLVVRQKDLMDNATPSANSVAANAFLRLASLTGDSERSDSALAVFKLLARVSPTAPTAFCNAAGGMLMQHRGMTEVVIPGEQPDMLRIIRDVWRPYTVVAWGAPTTSTLWEGREPGLAYVCRDHTCLLPARTTEELVVRLATNDSDVSLK